MKKCYILLIYFLNGNYIICFPISYHLGACDEISLVSLVEEAKTVQLHLTLRASLGPLEPGKFDWMGNMFEALRGMKYMRFHGHAHLK